MPFLYQNGLWKVKSIILLSKTTAEQSTLRNEMNVSPGRLSDTMIRQTSCFCKWKQIASTPLPLTHNDRKRLTRSALESDVGCVDLRLAEQQQCSEPILSSFSHIISTETIPAPQEPISILVYLQLAALNDCKAGFTDVGSEKQSYVQYDDEKLLCWITV